MLRTTKFMALPLIFTIAACANSGANYTPVIDGPVGPNYGNDLAQCQALAASQSTFDNNAGASAATGAGVAAATTAVFNNTGNNVRDAAILGAAAGLTSSAIQGNANKESIVANCMRGRGYNVVG